MHIIVGLGNPGRKYERTRHNVGFDAVGILSDKLKIRVGKLRCKAIVGEGLVEGEKLVLAMPQTYMNLSGESVRPLLDYYGVGPANLIVIYDDIDLELGRLRLRPRGSAGSHNGMKSILYHLGTEEFARVRVGIGKPQNENLDLKDYVTGHYTKEERQTMFDALTRAGDAALCVAFSGVEEAMQKYNGNKG